MKLVVYDCEILNVIPNSMTRGAPEEGVKYCKGWGDFEGMGISVICAYVWGEGYRVFLADNLPEFTALAGAESTILVGFNNRAFDDKLVAAHSTFVPEHRSWDLLREVRRAKGANPDAPGSGTGGLNGLAIANFLQGKQSTANAPRDWQQGLHGKVIDQCLNDVIITKKLVELALDYRLRDPATGRKLAMDISLLKTTVDVVQE